jgi:hypothetical protein
MIEALCFLEEPDVKQLDSTESKDLHQNKEKQKKNDGPDSSRSQGMHFSRLE